MKISKQRLVWLVTLSLVAWQVSAAVARADVSEVDRIRLLVRQYLLNPRSQVLGETITNTAPLPPEMNQPMMPPPGDWQPGGQPCSGSDCPPPPNQGFQPQQTCRVNGVDMPGSCDQYPPNQGPQPYQGFQPQPGPGQPGQMMGPDNQDWEKQEAEQQKRMEQEQAKQLKRIKSDASRTLSDAKRMKTQLAKFTKAGLNTTALAAAIADIEAFANKMKNAATMDDLEDLQGEDPGEKFGLVSELMGVLSRQLEIKQRILPQLTKNVKPFQTAYKRLAKNKNIDQTVLAEFKAALDELNGFINQLKTAGQTAASEEELENVFAMLDELPDKFNEVGLKQQAAEFFANYKRGITGFNTMIRNFTNAIKKADKNKADTAELKEQLAQIQQLFNEIKTAANTKPVDVELLMEKIDELSGLADELGIALNDLGVGVNVSANNVATPKLQQQQQMQFNMPSSFDFGGQQPPQPQMAPGTF